MKHDQIKNFNETMIKANEPKVPSIIYIDFRLIKDFFLGAILSLVETEEQYDYVLQNIDSYNNRVIDDVQHIFPKLNFTNNQVTAVYANGNMLYHISPSTSFSRDVLIYLTSINNKSAVIKRHKIPKLILNTYPITFPDSLSVNIALWFSNTYALDTRVINKPIGEVDKDLIFKIDEMYLYDLVSFVENPIYQAALQNQKFNNLILKGRKIIRNLQVLDAHDSAKSLDTEFIFIQSYCNFMCDFEFLPTITPIL